MKHRVAGRKLGRTSMHRTALLRNMSTELFRHERIRTTLMKAKELRPFAEKLITLSKRETLHARRLVLRDIHDKDVVSKLTAPVDMQTNELSKEGGSTKKGFAEAYFGTFMFVLVLFMTLLLYGIATMRGILEEKSSRVMEVLLGSVSPDELMSGKILGIGLVGLTQVAIYAVTAGLVRIYLATHANPDMAGALSSFTAGKMAFFLVFFLLGYFMYTALFACIGAVCNSEQEAQNLQSPVQMCLMLPMMATIFFVGQPDSTISVIVSLIPLFTPMVMFMRICVQTPPAWQIALSIALTLGATLLVFRGAAKVFRIGILMYGKRPTIPEILRWARS